MGMRAAHSHTISSLYMVLCGKYSLRISRTTPYIPGAYPPRERWAADKRDVIRRPLC